MLALASKEVRGGSHRSVLSPLGLRQALWLGLVPRVPELKWCWGHSDRPQGPMPLEELITHVS